MHSAFLRDSDFEIISKGKIIDFSEFATEVTESFRLGIYAPNGTDAVGAVTIIMAYMTAFYDFQRKQSKEFHLYPDFFTFQSVAELADYSMFDIWPKEKSIKIASGSKSLKNAILSNSIDLLLVPIDDMNINQSDSTSSAQINKKSELPCIGYSISGKVEESNLIVRCNQEILIEWSQTVLDSLPHPEQSSSQRATLPLLKKGSGRKFIEQSFRTISFDQYLSSLESD